MIVVSETSPIYCKCQRMSLLVYVYEIFHALYSTTKVIEKYNSIGAKTYININLLSLFKLNLMYNVHYDI